MQGAAQRPSLQLASTVKVRPLTVGPSHSRIFRTELATLQSRCTCCLLLPLGTAGMPDRPLSPFVATAVHACSKWVGLAVHHSTRQCAPPVDGASVSCVCPSLGRIHSIMHWPQCLPKLLLFFLCCFLKSTLYDTRSKLLIVSPEVPNSFSSKVIFFHAAVQECFQGRAVGPS